MALSDFFFKLFLCPSDEVETVPENFSVGNAKVIDAEIAYKIKWFDLDK